MTLIIENLCFCWLYIKNLSIRAGMSDLQGGGIRMKVTLDQIAVVHENEEKKRKEKGKEKKKKQRTIFVLLRGCENKLEQPYRIFVLLLLLWLGL